MTVKLRKKRPKIRDASEIVVGARFGRLTVVDIRKGEKYHNRHILCKCDCGKMVETSRNRICCGQESCSCKQYEDNRKMAYKHGMGGTRKEGHHDRFYTIYHLMKRRTSGKTYNPKDRCYAGIKCLWGSFMEFYNDMHESYLEHVKEYGEKNTTIDRIDSRGNYCKENCRRATIKEQSWNKNDTLKAIVDGKVYLSCDIADITGYSRDVARKRIKKYADNVITKEELLRHKQ